MAQVLAPGLVEVEGDMPCFPKHTIRASTSCGFPSGTLNMCVYDRSLSLKRMLERWAKVHLKRMVVRVLRAMARGGVRCTRGASLDCPGTGKVMLHACTEGSGHTDHTRTPATLTQGSSGILNSVAVCLCACRVDLRGTETTICLITRRRTTTP